MLFRSFSSLIVVAKTSKTMLNSSREIGHPCLVPDFTCWQRTAGMLWSALPAPPKSTGLPAFPGGLDSHLWRALAQPVPFKGPLPLKGRNLNSLAARVSGWACGWWNEERATLTRAFLARLALSQLLIFFSPLRPKLAFPPWLAKIVKGR